MKFSVAVAIAGFSSIALAQVSLSSLPTCAQGCVGQSVNVPGCSGLDIKCICTNKDYINSLSCCIVKTCNPDDQKKAIGFAAQLCATAGVTVPNSVSCAADTPPSSAAAGAGAGAGAMAPAPSSASPTSAPASSSSAAAAGASSSMMSSSNMASMSMSSASSSMSSASSSVSSASPVSSASATATATASASVSKTSASAAAAATANAAGSNIANGMGLAGAMIAAAALL